MKKAVVFGIGMDYYLGFYQIKEQYQIIALMDNDKSSREWAENEKINEGLKIISPSELENEEMDIVLITATNPVYIDEMKAQLYNMGIPKEQVVVFKRKEMSPFLIDPKFYEKNLTYEEKKELFANNVESVTIEPNSRCNRKCWFCPNSVLDRYTENISMKRDIFEKIIKELEEIDYNAIITYSFYNEPLLDENLEDKIRYQKEHLPKSISLVSTNGDYLTKERLHSLIDAGLDDMIISVYNENNPNFEWTIEKAKERVEYFIEKLELDVIYMSKSKQAVTAYASKGKLNMRLQNHDFRYAAHNRGEILPSELFSHPEEREKFCANSFITLNIFYDGSVYTCGNRRHDYEGHKEFEMGNVAEDNIYNIFDSEAATKFRKNFTADSSRYPCRTCSCVAETFTPQFPNIPLRDRPRYTRNCK